MLVYGIITFLVMQCYMLPFASEEDKHYEEIATIGDATWTTAVPESALSGDVDDLSEGSLSVANANSDRYYIEPDRTNLFVAYAMTAIPRGSGMNVTNQCAIYVARVLNGYYGDKAPVAGSTLVSQISNTLSKNENWECIFSDVSCFPRNQTEAQYDAIFDRYTNAGDVVCFVDGSKNNYVHCAIAGGGVSLVGHLTSSGWDSVRACYYIDNAVDTRKKCTGMLVYRPVERHPDTGTIRVCKNYDEEIYRTNPEAYDIGGANYAIYSNREDALHTRNILGYCNIEPGENGELAGDNVSGYARTKPNEQGDIVQFQEGTYYIKEFNVPISGSWKLDETVYTTYIYAGKRTTFGFPRDKFANPMTLPQTDEYYDQRILGPEEARFGHLSLKKHVADAYQSIVAENENYTLKGIEYTIYAVGADREINETNPVGVFEIDADGIGTVKECKYNIQNVGTINMDLPFGWYMVRESKANASMRLDMTPQWVHIADEKEVLTEAEDVPNFGNVRFLLYKAGSDGKPVEDAEYEICYYDVMMDENPGDNGYKPIRVWNFKTDKKGQIYYSDDTTWFIDGDPLYKDRAGNIVLPVGTVTFQEKKAPKGYVLDDEVYVNRIQPGDDTSISAENVVNIIEKQVRGDIEFIKKAENGKTLADVKFSITDSSGETHIIWTDKDGYCSTASSYIPHTKDTNSGEKGSGIWFGNTEPDDSLGALPYGTYVIEELRCEANKNKYRSMEKKTVDVSEEGIIVDLGTFVNYEFPTIKTKASYDQNQIDFSDKNKTIICEDKVLFTNLEIGHAYVIEGDVHNQIDGKALEQNKKKVTGRTEFVATETDMEMSVWFEIDFTEDLYGTSWVFYETVTDPAYPGEKIAVHEDLDDLAQTIKFPEPTTTEETTEQTTVEGTSTEMTEQPQSNSEVRTGDESRIFLVILIVCTAALGIIMMIIGKMRIKRR